MFFTPEDEEVVMENFDPESSYLLVPELPDLSVSRSTHAKPLQYFAKIDLETPIVCYNGAKFIASKLDTDIRM